MPKFLLIFDKGEPVRWLGHLDILRTFERAIRRAELPIAFSNGFNPRERLAFASALGTGVTGSEERAILELTDSCDPDQIPPRLNAALPSGIRIVCCEPIADAAARSVLNGYDRSEYNVVCAIPIETRPVDVVCAVTQLLEQEKLPIRREREGKTRIVDIRPSLYHLELLSESITGDRLTLRMQVGQGESGTAKPAEVTAALAELLPGLTLRRTHRVRLLKTD